MASMAPLQHGRERKVGSLDVWREEATDRHHIHPPLLAGKEAAHGEAGSVAGGNIRFNRQIGHECVCRTGIHLVRITHRVNMKEPVHPNATGFASASRARCFSADRRRSYSGVRCTSDRAVLAGDQKRIYAKSSSRNA